MTLAYSCKSRAAVTKFKSVCPSLPGLSAGETEKLHTHSAAEPQTSSATSACLVYVTSQKSSYSPNWNSFDSKLAIKDDLTKKKKKKRKKKAPVLYFHQANYGFWRGRRPFSGVNGDRLSSTDAPTQCHPGEISSSLRPRKYPSLTL